MKNTFSEFITLYEQDTATKRIQTIEKESNLLIRGLEGVLDEESYKVISDTFDKSLKKAKQVLLTNGLYSME